MKKLVTENKYKSLALLLLVLLTSVIGLKLTNASFAARPTGTLDIITYEGSVGSGNEIGGITVTTDQGGSTVQCSPRSGTTDSNRGGNYGHVHLSCGAALNGGPLTYVLTGVSRSGYSLSPNSPHQIGDTFRISSGQTTRLSLVVDGPPRQQTSTSSSQNNSQSSSSSQSSQNAPSGTPNGTLDIVTYENSVKDGNEIGSVKVVVDQGGSGVQCSNRSGTTDPGGGNNHGHVHLSCPAAQDGGPRTYVIQSVERDGYSLASSSPHQINDAFHINGNQTTVLSLVLVRNGSQNQSSDDQPQPADKSYTPQPVDQKPQEAPNVGKINVTAYKHDKNGESVSTTDKRLDDIYVKTVNIGVPSSSQCPNPDGRTNQNGQISFSDCPVAISQADDHAKKYQVQLYIPEGYQIDEQYNNRTNTVQNGNSLVRTITVRKNQATDVSFVLVQPKAQVSSNGSGDDFAINYDVTANDSAWRNCLGCYGPGSNSDSSPEHSVRYKVVQIARREANAQRTQDRQLTFMNADYGKNPSLGASDPWCAFFVSYVYKKGGVSDPPREGCSGTIAATWARPRGSWHPIRGPGAKAYSPKPGDAVIFSKSTGVDRLICYEDSRSGSTHIGIVVKYYGNGNFDTIEGNVSDRVSKLKRNAYTSQANGGNVLGFVSPIKGE